MIHRICFLIGGLPSQMIAMRYGYRYFFSGLLCASGAVGRWYSISDMRRVLIHDHLAWTQAWMQSATGFYVTRGLIGLLEGGFGPLIVMCLSNFYTNKELGFRVAILTSGINVSSVLHCQYGRIFTIQFARLQKHCPLYWLQACLTCEEWLVSQVSYCHGRRGWLITKVACAGWFWLILINGLLVFMVGLVVRQQAVKCIHVSDWVQSIFYLPSGPTKTQTVLWRKPWFTKREQGEMAICYIYCARCANIRSDYDQQAT